MIFLCMCRSSKLSQYILPFFLFNPLSLASKYHIKCIAVLWKNDNYRNAKQWIKKVTVINLYWYIDFLSLSLSLSFLLQEILNVSPGRKTKYIRFEKECFLCFFMFLDNLFNNIYLVWGKFQFLKPLSVFTSNCGFQYVFVISQISTKSRLWLCIQCPDSSPQ